MSKKSKGFMLVAALFIVITSFTIVLVTQWEIPKSTKANFTINGLLGKDVHGSLMFDTSLVLFEPKYLKNSSMQVSLVAASIHTGNKDRDKHLRSADFFNVEKYPYIRFKSKSFSQSNDSTFAVTGDLSIKDSTKEVTIPFTYVPAGDSSVFKGSFTLLRLDYGVGTKFKKGIGKEVHIDLHVPVFKRDN